MKNDCALCGLKTLKLIINLDWPLYQCSNCGLIQVYPLPNKKSIQKLYQGNYWKNYISYGSQSKAHQKYFQKKIIEIYKYKQSGKLLDVGCALGDFLLIAARKGFDTTGIDISYYSVKHCKKLGLRTYQNTTASMKKTNYFDLITAFETIEHELKPVNSVKKIYSMLKPGGIFVIIVPNTEAFTNKLMGKFWFGFRNKEHLFHFNQKSLSLLIKLAGFSELKIVNDSSRPYLFVYGLRRLNFYFFKSKFINMLINKLEKIRMIKNIEIGFNPWGNLIAFAQKND